MIIHANERRVITGDFYSEGIDVFGTLIFNPKYHSHLMISGNLIIHEGGRLVMLPVHGIHHFITFKDIDENTFKGGADCCAIESDWGLWVYGELNLRGIRGVRNSWVKFPKGKGNFAFTEGSEGDIELSSNVVIQGTPTGRTHIAIMNGKQSISGVEIRHVGPRKDGKKILGRYGLHFHHCGESSRGSFINDVVVHNCGSHAFVAHNSHGISFENCIAYKVNESAYWWDQPKDQNDESNNSNDIMYYNCIAARLEPIPAQRGYDLTGFLLGSGTGNKILFCKVVGNMGRGKAGAFMWPEDSNHTPNKWEVYGLLATNCYAYGLNIWQNDDSDHLIENVLIMDCFGGILHGAYRNGYHYKDIQIAGCDRGIEIHALPSPNAVPDERGYRSSFTNVNAEMLFVMPHTLPGGSPILFKDCEFNEVHFTELPARVPNPPGGQFDFVDCGVIYFGELKRELGTIIRIQDANGAFVLENGDSWQLIENFYL